MPRSTEDTSTDQNRLCQILKIAPSLFHLTALDKVENCAGGLGRVTSPSPTMDHVERNAEGQQQTSRGPTDHQPLPPRVALPGRPKPRNISPLNFFGHTAVVLQHGTGQLLQLRWANRPGVVDDLNECGQRVLVRTSLLCRAILILQPRKALFTRSQIGSLASRHTPRSAKATPDARSGPEWRHAARTLR